MGHGMTGVVGGGAMRGIEMALWDIKGKALGLPVWNLLGGKIRDKVRIYTHAHEPEQARELVDGGYVESVGCSYLNAAQLQESLDVSQRKGYARLEVTEPPDITSVLAGARTIEHIDNTIRARDKGISQALRDEMSAWD